MFKSVGHWRPAGVGHWRPAGGSTPTRRDRSEQVVIDSLEGVHTWDVLLPSQRRLVWAYLALLQPIWVHLGPPCTFWSRLASCRNLRSEADNEHLRLKALAPLVFSLQVCNFQRRHQRYWSLEQPPHCASWNLDIVKEFTERELATGNAALKFDSCAWGHKDPRNGKPFP